MTVMKLKNLTYFALLSSCIVGFNACTNEAPFETSGEGMLKLNKEYRSDIKVSTRAIEGYTDEYLDKNLVVYIENSKGVIRKFIGANSIPEAFPLSVGTYVVEGWTGDSVSASFDKKFFRGYKDNVQVGNGNNVLSLKLDIKNVVVAIDECVLQEEITDLNIQINHTRDKLEFTPEIIKDKKRGYFMMPNNDNTLQYTITGKNALGEEFTKSGEIKDVESAHLYNLKISSEETEITDGGALVRIEIEDIPIIEEYVEILPAPAFKAIYGSDGFNLENQVVAVDNKFLDLKVRSLAYESLKSLTLNFSNNFEGLEDIEGKNLVDDASMLNSKGLKLEIDSYKDASAISKNDQIDVVEAWLTLSSEFLNGLKESTTAYEITLKAEDERGYRNSVVINIANTNEALRQPAPVGSAAAPDKNKEPMAILATSATLTGSILTDDAKDYGIKYRAQGETEFKEVKATLTKAAGDIFEVTLTDLKPATTYEYKAFCDGFEEENVRTFNTESIFPIPYGDMETWSTHTDNSAMVGSSGTAEFWDTGNHGSQTLKKNITEKFVIGDNTVARLKSQYVSVATIGKFAAGNLFVGEFGKTVGMSGAIVHFGQPFNGTHPSALKVKVNYNPGNVNYADSKAPLSKGDIDEGQIYIALATEKQTVDNTDLENGLFNPSSPSILAYGELTMKEAVGNDNELIEKVINLTYYERAKSETPSYIIIVCSSSKYGDYFTGSSTSVMYVDDFELEYGEVQFE